MPKVILRQRMLAERKSLSATEVRSASKLIQQKFIGSVEFARAKVLALYAPIRNEVDTAEILHEAVGFAKVVLYPAVCSGKLEFRQILKLAELKCGTFGVPEPDAACLVYDPQQADIIVIPGVAFDVEGRRIGYGKGYYDQALHMLEGQGKLLGLCYDFQLVDKISGEPHDVTMDVIITEKRVIRLFE